MSRCCRRAACSRSPTWPSVRCRRCCIRCLTASTGSPPCRRTRCGRRWGSLPDRTWSSCPAMPPWSASWRRRPRRGRCSSPPTICSGSTPPRATRSCSRPAVWTPMPWPSSSRFATARPRSRCARVCPSCTSRGWPRSRRWRSWPAPPAGSLPRWPGGCGRRPPAIRWRSSRSRATSRPRSAPDASRSTQPLPVGQRLEDSFAARAATLPEASRQALLVAATSYTGATDTLLAALGELGLASDALDAAEEEDLVSIAHGTLTWRHPARALRHLSRRRRPGPADRPRRPGARRRRGSPARSSRLASRRGGGRSRRGGGRRA